MRIQNTCTQLDTMCVLSERQSMGNPLLLAVRKGDTIAAKRILVSGHYSEIDAQGSQHDGTALFLACCKGMTSVVRLLLLRGACIQAVTSYGATPLHAAVDHNQIEITRFLLGYGAEVNAQTTRGDTPCHYASYRGFVSLVQILVEAGADVTAENNKSKTPIDLARSRNHSTIARYLQAVAELVKPTSSPDRCTDLLKVSGDMCSVSGDMCSVSGDMCSEKCLVFPQNDLNFDSSLDSNSEHFLCICGNSIDSEPSISSTCSHSCGSTRPGSTCSHSCGSTRPGSTCSHSFGSTRPGSTCSHNNRPVSMDLSYDSRSSILNSHSLGSKFGPSTLSNDLSLSSGGSRKSLSIHNICGSELSQVLKDKQYSKDVPFTKF